MLVLAYGLWIYGILFFIIFAETGFVVFPFLPGDSLLFVGGALAAIGEGGMDITTLVGTLSAAAILGNMVNYQIGRYLGPRVFQWENSRFFNRTALEKTHAFYAKHGGKTLVLSRFLPLFRTFAPFVAGIGGMSYARFSLFNLIGAVSWVLSLCLAGLLVRQHAMDQAESDRGHSRHRRHLAAAGADRLSEAPGSRLMHGLAIFIALVLMACSTRLDRDGRTETTMNVKYLAKTEVDRIADSSRAEVVGGLMLIADKLYRRNPKEWKKAGVASRAAALERLSQRQTRSLPELDGAREGQAANLAFSEAYAGDRVAALMFGLLSMADAAFEHKEEFYVLDGLNEFEALQLRPQSRGRRLEARARPQLGRRALPALERA